MKYPLRFVKLKHLASALFLLAAAASVGFSQAAGPFSINTSPLPAPTGFINDYAGVIDAATKSRLETRLKEFKERSSSSTELAVAVVKTTGERPIFDYSLAVARGWKIGSKEDDNPGALLFIAIDDRKYFTQVSKDLEDELPDGLVGSLQRQYLVPEFKKGDYGKGISDTIEAYIRTIEARRSGMDVPAVNSSEETETAGSQSLYSLFCCLVALIVLGLIIYSNFKKPSKDDNNWWGGGGFGGGGGLLPWIIVGGSGSSSGGSSSWGGGSDWGGSSGGWGGFGGGGDFGGGGAGGGW